MTKDERILKLYGKPLGWYYRQLKKQHGGCFFCGRKPKPNKRLNVDHSHLCCKKPPTCGKCTRGLLCAFCNRRVLAWIEKMGAKPQRIVDYLKEYDPTNPVLKG